MRKLLTILAMIVGSSALAMPGPTINGNQINPQSAISIATFTVTGADPVKITGGVSAGNLTASSGTFTASGGAQFSVQTSSGIKVQNGTLSVLGFGGIDARGTGIIASTITVGGANNEQMVITGSANGALNQWCGLNFTDAGDNAWDFRCHYGGGTNQKLTFSPANTTELTVTQHSTSQYGVSVDSGLAILHGGLYLADSGTVLFSTAGLGGGGISSMQIASGTVSGGNIGTAAGSLLTATSFYLDSAGLTLTRSGNAAIIGVKNLTFVAAGIINPMGSTTQSTPGVCQFSNSTMTWTQGNNKTQFTYSGSANTSAGNVNGVALLLDGVVVSSVTAYCAGNSCPLTMIYQTPTALSAGQHNACFSFWTGGGTMNIPSAGGSGTLAPSGSQGTYTEINTSGSGYSAPASTWTQLSGTVSAFTNTAANCDSTGSTVTLTMRGGRMLIGFEGQANNSVKDSLTHVGIMVDGQLIDGETATALFSPAQAAAASDRWNAGFTHLTQNTYTGSHSVCLAKVVNANTGAICDNGGNACRLWVKEDLNAAGTGDVSSNGAYKLTGTGEIAGPLTISGPSFNAQMPYYSSATFSAVTSSTIPLVSVSSVVYSLKGLVTPSGNSRLLLQVSGDNTASWNYVTRGNSIGGQDTQSGSAVAFCALTESNATNNSPIRGVPTLYDLTVIVTPTDIVVHAMPAYRGLSTDPAVEVNGTCTWERTGFSFSNLVITMSDGSTMSGSWYLNKW